MALRIGCRDPCSDGLSELALLDALMGGQWIQSWAEQVSKEQLSKPFLYTGQLSQNWSGQEESDCLIKTKHCDGL